jgi:hypothetical protein
VKTRWRNPYVPSNAVEIIKLLRRQYWLPDLDAEWRMRWTASATEDRDRAGG